MLKYLAMSCNVFPSQIPQYLPSSNCNNSRLPQELQVCQGTLSQQQHRQGQGALDGGMQIRPLPLLSSVLFPTASQELKQT